MGEAACGHTVLYVGDASPLYEREAFDKLYQSVSEERRAKTDRLRFRKDKCLSLCAEALLMRACEDFGIPSEVGRLVLGRYSKPSFAETDVQFNLSHSGTKALCVMSELEVGCDIEEVRGYKRSVAERFFTAAEKELLSGCPDDEARERMFYRLWTMKESFLKCTGRGLSLPLDSFSVIPTGEGRARVEQGLNEASYLVFEGELAFGGASPELYHYAVCVKKPETGKELLPPEIRFCSL